MIKWGWRSPIGTNGFPAPTLNEACLVDVDNDNYLEIVVADYSCLLVCLDCEGSGAEEDTKPHGCASVLTTLFRDEIELILPRVKWVKYTLYDVCGRIVYDGSKSEIEGKISLNVSGVRAGIYFLKVKTPRESHTFKVVKIL